ncbi:MAG: PRC-barrel domain-containing protein, partial [Rhodospirillales bacterium]|nr:PRC-barrel domain-containing protein [Rhodospirillales bacterium]
MTDDGGMRSSKIVGSSVYNDKDEKVGSVDDLVIGSDKSLHAVISVGGVLGMGAKMVEVPFDKLQFGNTKGSSDNRIVMPGATADGRAVLRAWPSGFAIGSEQGRRPILLGSVIREQVTHPWGMASLSEVPFVTPQVGGDQEMVGTCEAMQQLFRTIRKWLGELSDDDVAAVLSYIRDAWGNGAPPVGIVSVHRARER